MSAVSPAGETYWDVTCDADNCTTTERRENLWPPKGSPWKATSTADYCPEHSTTDR